MLCWHQELNSDRPATDQKPEFVSFYLEDGVLVGEHQILQRALDFLQSSQVRARGAHLRMSKCNLWWPKPPPPQDDENYPLSLRRVTTPMHSVLTAPIGCHRSIMNDILRQVELLQPLLGELQLLDNAQTALTLLRRCLGTCRIMHMLRVTPPTATRQAARRYDEMMRDALASLMGGVLPMDTFRELQLPICNLPDEQPTFGMGITSAADVAPAAYLASLSLTQDLRVRMLSTVSRPAFDIPWFADQAHRLLTLRMPPNRSSPLTKLSEQPVEQRELCNQIYQHTFDNLPKGTERIRAFRNTLKLSGAKDWILMSPSPQLRTHVPNALFRVWLKFYCRLPVRADEETQCPRPNC